MLSQKQKTIVDFILKGNGEITKKQAVDLIGKSYYCNKAKHVGDVLSRMVKRGILTRIKPGLFKISDKGPKDNFKNYSGPGQTDIFKNNESNEK